MGGERASSTRQRLAGKVCCRCRRALDPLPWHTYGERYCDRCEPPTRVYMRFTRVDDRWCVTCHTSDLKATYPRRFTFTQDATVIEMAERGGASMALDDRQALEMGLRAGQGAVWLSLSKEQVAKLR